MFGDLFSLRNIGFAALAAIVPAFSSCIMGCTTTWKTTNGTMTFTFRPGIILQTDTKILFNDGPDPLVKIETDFEADGETDDVEDSAGE